MLFKKPPKLVHTKLTCNGNRWFAIGEIASTFRSNLPHLTKCTLGFHLHGSWKVRRRRWKWWYGSAFCILHIRHQFQVEEVLLQTGTEENCTEIKLQNLSPLSCQWRLKVDSISEMQSTWLKSSLYFSFFFKKQNLRKIHNWQVCDNQQKWLLPVAQSEKVKFSAITTSRIVNFFVKVWSAMAYGTAIILLSQAGKDWF